jgi:lipopolysaccharide transport system ATP-binding protein
MAENVIEVRGLGKRYRISHQGKRGAKRYVALRDVITEKAVGSVRAIKNAFGSNGDEAGAGLFQKKEDFWALRDVSFDIKEGEVVGIIGRNGAGKSTLLKLLSRITEPTEGRMHLRGTVASLLEVGTGFHPELTGRENIILNGVMLGMPQAEVRKKFDEIVAFAEVDRFLDTAVKHYSSGMYMKLAFSVAAHLEPEILIVDEVLAVGDAQFQKKCLGKVQDVSSHGRTVLFVSHSMPTILHLCKRVLLLQRGSLIADGPAAEVTHTYLKAGAESPVERTWDSPQKAPGDHVARLKAVRIKNLKGQLSETIDVNEPFEVEVEYWNLQDRLKPTVSVRFVNEEGILLFVANDFSNNDWWNSPRKPGVVRATCRVPASILSEGQHFIEAAVCTYNPPDTHVYERDVISFQAVDQQDLDKTREKYVQKWPGLVRPKITWTIQNEH